MRHPSDTIAVTALAAVMSVSTMMVNAPGAQATPLGPPPAEQSAPGSSIPDSATSVLPVRSRATGRAIDLGSTTSPIAPGLSLTQFNRLDSGGWIRGDVLSADLSEPRLAPEYLHAGPVAQRAPLTDEAAQRHAVGGVNGDFFDIDASGAPLGVGIDRASLRNAPGGGHNLTAAVTDGPQRVGRLMDIFLEATITHADGSVMSATDLNAPKVSPGGIAVYTPLWGSASRATAVEGAHRVTEVEIRNGIVSAVARTPTQGPIPDGAVRLLGSDAGADALASLRPGERVSVGYQPRAAGQVPAAAVGGDKVLLRDGQVQPVDDTAVHPRTAAGFSADGKRMWLTTIDGRQLRSRGMTERELAEQMKALGADDAINLDGGGSSTLVARKEGGNAASIQNSPSDGLQRPVPNGIGFTAAPGSGHLRGFRVEPATPAEHSDRVLAGLSRRISAYGHDETGAPVHSDPQWTVSPGVRGTMRPEAGLGVFRARQPGEARITARKGAAAGETCLDVLGPPTRLAADTGQLRLPGGGAQGHFQVRGYDGNGFGTWVEPSDVQLEYDPKLLRISPERDGFTVTALVPEAAAVVTAHAGGVTTHVGVAVGSRPQQLSPLDGAGGWHASAYPQQVHAAIAGGAGHAGTPGLALNYSLTGSTATRAAYVNADQPIALPPGTQKVGAWVNGDGHGGWLRYTIVDASGVATAIDLARKVDWTGWRYVEGAIPPGIASPVRLQRMYVVETDPSRQYEGSLVFDDLTASVAPAVDLPPERQPHSPSVVQNGTLPHTGGANRIAVVSDAQFTADAPDGPLVHAARRALREALGTRPDLIVIDGDFVDRGTAADFRLARQVIESEIGGRARWVYVPGNHETYGPGNLSEFAAVFGQPTRVVDTQGTRQVFLDSSLGSLRAGGIDQIAMLRNALDTAATDRSISSVAVFLHHPPNDPAPGGNAQLSDPQESELLERWLSDFERSSGKPAVVVAGHAGTFHASIVDGVDYLVNGNAGKAASAAPGDGGFNGWSLLRIDPHDREPVRWETNPYVDDLRLDAPTTLSPGAPQQVRAHLTQGSRTVPVSYPVSEDWTGSPELFIGPASRADGHKVAAFDPATGVLTGLRPGLASLSLTVNGATKTVRFNVT